ncbi:MAG: hypothetical protein ABIP34_20540, partial [Rhodoferax sp.]|uniref:hypothetical protein n=1 Tax=Rhodoferax sp. TaxID=50421 RepID=UPI00326451DD
MTEQNHTPSQPEEGEDKSKLPHTEPVYEPEILSAIPVEIVDTSYGEGSITILEGLEAVRKR